MIDTNKLIPQRKEGARLSEKTITTIGFIKKDVVKIDSLLKERLVLSKVRYGILRQQNEREKRLGREKSLERKKSRPQDFGFNMMSNKKGKGLGGFLGGMLKSILGVLGFSIFKSLPGLIRVGRLIKTIAVPFTALVGVAFLTLRTIVNVGRKISAETRGLDPKKINRDAVNKGINNFSTQLVRAAQAFAAGVAGGIIAQRLVRGRTFTEEQAVDLLQTQKRELRGGTTAKAKKFSTKLKSAKQRSLLVDDNFSLNPIRKKTFTELAEVEVASEMAPSRIPKGMTPYQYETLYGAQQFREIGEGNTVSASDVVLKTKRKPSPKKKITNIKKTPKPKTPEPSPKKKITQIKPDPKASIKIKDATGRKRVSMDPYEIAMQPRMEKLAKDARRMFPNFTNKQIIEIVRRERESSVRLKKLLPESQLKELDPEYYKRFKKAQRDIDRLTSKPLLERMSDAFKNKRFPKEMTKAERLAQEAANKQRTLARAAAKEAKERAAKLATKKGLSRLLFKFGGEALEQSVKQVVKQSVSTIPLIGDLIGFLLDIFLFKQPVGRAAFMASGSILGGMIGGILGLIGGPPGVLVGSIIGGIGGDLLGGAFYDLIVGEKSIGVVQQVGESAVKKTIKGAGLPGFTLGGFTGLTGGYTHPMEFVIDRNSTLELERNAPGFLSALNKASGSGVIDVLRSYTSYESTDSGTETFIPLPFEKIVTRTITVGGESGDTDDSTSPFMDLYRRG